MRLFIIIIIVCWSISNLYKIRLPPLLFLQSVVYETPKINRCFLIENNDTAVLKTEGVNLQVSDRPRDREPHDL